MENCEYIKRIHEEIMYIMDNIDRVCNDNNLRYYMIGGTLLGSVRHKGFIPWDDDLDIVMPRDDFNRFIKICEKELGEPFKLIWFTSDDNYWLPFAKIGNKSTLFIESGFENTGKKQNIFVDIFPLDDIEKYSAKVERRKKILLKIFAIIRLRLERKNYTGIKRLLLEILPTKSWYKIMIKIATKDNNKNYSYFINYGSQYSAKKQTILKDWFGEGVKLKFENRYYRAPKEYIKVLTSIFGDSYMELPPENKRRTHYPLKVRFSDGTEAEFEQPKEKIKVN